MIAPNCAHPVVYQQSNGLMKYDIFTQWTIIQEWNEQTTALYINVVESYKYILNEERQT